MGRNAVRGDKYSLGTFPLTINRSFDQISVSLFHVKLLQHVNKVLFRTTFLYFVV